VKKKHMKQELRDRLVAILELQTQLGEAREKLADLGHLRHEVEQMRQHWRPVPITHEWTPRDPQCALCDEPRDALRHQMPVVPDGG
jgi:hypothetical protein